MLSINGKKFMNLPEAVQWLLNNNALPFQCKANYVADTVIAKSDIINPSPAEIKVGSLVLFADSKVGTVSGVTDSGFMVGQDYTDIASGLIQITDISINSSAHMIITLSDGSTIDAGLIKEVSGFSIDGSQHLIVTYNDGDTNDLGAIFQGNVNIAGNFTADSIIENMNGYSYTPEGPSAGLTFDVVYSAVVKNGNKLTFVNAVEVTRTGTCDDIKYFGTFGIPSAIGAKLFPAIGSNILYADNISLVDGGLDIVTKKFACVKSSNVGIYHQIYGMSSLTLNNKYYFRIEETFLLADNMAA